MDDKATAPAEQAYCVKCREKRNMMNAAEVEMNGKGAIKRRAMTGTCEKCGTKMYKILSSAKKKAE